MTETVERPRSDLRVHDGIERLSRRDVTALGVLLVSTFVVVLNETILSVALPVLITKLHITTTTGQWLSTAFALTLAVVIPVTGFLIRRFTTRSLFLIAMGLFSLGTLTAALAPGFGVLLVARIVQACGAAVMIPLLMTTVMTVVPDSRRGQMMGNISIVISVAPALGPTISGLILTALPWPWIFWIVLPFGLASVVLGSRLLQNVGETVRVPIDWLSVPLSALGFGGLVYGLNAVGAAAQGGSSSPLVMWGSVAVGVLALTAFLLRQWRLQRADRALLDLRVFASRIFTSAVAAGSLAFLALLGSTILLPLYLEGVLRYTPLQTGLLVLPGGLLMGASSPLIGRIYDRIGPRALLVAGGIAGTVALALLGLVGTGTSLWYVLACHMLLSLGLACMLTPLFTAGLGAVPSHLTSYGSAVFGTLQQVGGAAGTALVVTLLAVGAASAESSGTTGAAAQVAGDRLAFLVAAVIFALGFVVSFGVRRPPSNDGQHAA